MLSVKVCRSWGGGDMRKKSVKGKGFLRWDKISLLFIYFEPFTSSV